MPALVSRPVGLTDNFLETNPHISLLTDEFASDHVDVDIRVKLPHFPSRVMTGHYPSELWLDITRQSYMPGHYPSEYRHPQTKRSEIPNAHGEARG